ncbi:peroxisomal membrane protein 2 [Chelonus insularis]|uniref:peroxisomal membrane protein 2 n=1 Tax=Chelonus insularis TaxID=460826 RepID=UPI00158A9FE0|nr:peroxisomal membrane protein 2 [Chelonus insularis]
MALSKPSEFLFDLVVSYMNNLYTSPLKTKAITSCTLAVFGNYISQKIQGIQEVDGDSLVAFGLFGLLFGGPVPHFFYKYIYRFTKNPIAVLAIERLLYTPLFQALSLYMISRFEGKLHEESVRHTKLLYLPILMANWKYLTILHFINIRYVPPMLKTLMVNMIGLIWVIYLAKQRASKNNKRRQV